MKLLFELITITSILVLAYTIVTQEKMLLHGIRRWANKLHDEGHIWTEPVFLCHWCMPSVWSLFGFFFAWGIGLIQRFTWNMGFYYVLCVGGSSLVCGLVWGWHLKQDSENSLNDEMRIYLMKEGYKEEESEEEENQESLQN